MSRYLIMFPFLILSTVIPLFSGIGANLEYEYALLSSWSILALIPIAALVTPERFLPAQNGEYDLVASREVFWSFLFAPAIAFLPGILMFMQDYCQCSKNGFMFWMFLIFYPACILAQGIYHGIIRGRLFGYQKKTLGFVAYLCCLLIAGFGLGVLWLEPQKRIDNMVLGFLHGPIYDDWIAVDHGIVFVRLGYLFASMTILFGAWYRGQLTLLISTAVAAGLWIGAGTLSTSYPSTSNKKAGLNQVMYSTISGKGFTIHYRPGVSEDNATPQGTVVAVERLYRDTQFHIDELTKILGSESTNPHVQVYAYPSDEKKKLWFGGAATDVTDVRTPSIHIALGSYPHPTLRHELVHALSSRFGFHGLGFHPNIAFTEGLAVALAPDGRGLSLDQGAASLIESGKINNVQALLTPFFWKESGSRAYTVAGSLIRFMIDTYGFKAVKDLYAGASFAEATNLSEDQVIDAWKSKIMKGYDKSKTSMYAESLFRAQGVLDELCPHSKADLSRSRLQSIYVRARQPAGWDPESDYMPWLLSLDPNSPDTLSRIWHKEIRHLANERFPKEGRLNTWIETLSKARQMPPKTIEDVEFAVLESDIDRIIGKKSESTAILNQLLQEASHHTFGDNLLRVIAARQRIEDVAGANSLEWRRYLAGFRKNLPDVSVNLNDPWIIQYLKVKNGHEIKFSKEQMTQMVMSGPQLDPNLPSTFQFEMFRVLGHRLMEMEDYTHAAEAYRKAAAASTDRPEAKELFNEHMRRAKYYESLGPLRRKEGASTTG